MKNIAIMDNVTRIFYRTGLKIRKHSPEILMFAGVAGIVTSGVMACKATLKVEGILTEAKQKIDAINEVKEDHIEDGEYAEKDYKKAMTLASAHTGMELVKLYGPSVVLATVSIGCLVGSNRILNKRNVALTAAYGAVANNFRDYRDRVIDRFGKELDRELKYGIKAKEIEETVIDENGNEKTVKSTIDVVDHPVYSEFARFFDDGCKGWEKDAEYNLMFLLQTQEQANKKFKRQGHLFLNDVYSMLGIPKTQAGQMVGWYYDEEHPTGDNYIDFGIHNVHNAKARDFVNGYERVILLDFNVDAEPVIKHL